jgi:hypothetical protein
MLLLFLIYLLCSLRHYKNLKILFILFCFIFNYIESVSKLKVTDLKGGYTE